MSDKKSKKSKGEDEVDVAPKPKLKELRMDENNSFIYPQRQNMVEEEDLDDPIKLLNNENSTNIWTRTVVSDALDATKEIKTEDEDEDVIFIRQYKIKPCNKPVKSKLPVPFYDIPRNVRLLKQCCPLNIPVVDCKKYPWFYKRFYKNGSLNINSVESDIIVEDIDLDEYRNFDSPDNDETLVTREDKTFKENANNCTPSDKVVVIIDDDELDSRSKFDSSENDVILIRSENKTFEERFSNIYLANKIATKRKREINDKGDRIGQIPFASKLEQIDYKKNIGLVGLKIKVKPNTGEGNKLNIKQNERDILMNDDNTGEKSLPISASPHEMENKSCITQSPIKENRVHIRDVENIINNYIKTQTNTQENLDNSLNYIKCQDDLNALKIANTQDEQHNYVSDVNKQGVGSQNAQIENLNKTDLQSIVNEMTDTEQNIKEPGIKQNKQLDVAHIKSRKVVILPNNPITEISAINIVDNPLNIEVPNTHNQNIPVILVNNQKPRHLQNIVIEKEIYVSTNEEKSDQSNKKHMHTQTHNIPEILVAEHNIPAILVHNQNPEHLQNIVIEKEKYVSTNEEKSDQSNKKHMHTQTHNTPEILVAEQNIPAILVHNQKPGHLQNIVEKETYVSTNEEKSDQSNKKHMHTQTQNIPEILHMGHKVKEFPNIDIEKEAINKEIQNNRSLETRDHLCGSSCRSQISIPKATSSISSALNYETPESKANNIENVSQIPLDLTLPGTQSLKRMKYLPFRNPCSNINNANAYNQNKYKQTMNKPSNENNISRENNSNNTNWFSRHNCNLTEVTPPNATIEKFQNSYLYPQQIQPHSIPTRINISRSNPSHHDNISQIVPNAFEQYMPHQYNSSSIPNANTKQMSSHAFSQLPPPAPLLSSKPRLQINQQNPPQNPIRHGISTIAPTPQASEPIKSKTLNYNGGHLLTTLSNGNENKTSAKKNGTPTITPKMKPALSVKTPEKIEMLCNKNIEQTQRNSSAYYSPSMLPISTHQTRLESLYTENKKSCAKKNLFSIDTSMNNGTGAKTVKGQNISKRKSQCNTEQEKEEHNTRYKKKTKSITLEEYSARERARLENNFYGHI